MREIPKDWSVRKVSWETKLTTKLSIISIKIEDEGELKGTSKKFRLIRGTKSSPPKSKQTNDQTKDAKQTYHSYLPASYKALLEAAPGEDQVWS